MDNQYNQNQNNNLNDQGGQQTFDNPQWRCSSCGSSNGNSAKFCRLCGQPKPVHNTPDQINADQGYQNQNFGYSQQPNNGYPNQNYQNQGYNNQGYPNGMPQNGGMYPPPQGMPMNNMVPPPNRPASGYAVASLVLGIIAILGSCWIISGIICGVLAIIFGRKPIFPYQSGEGMAKAGLVCGTIALALSVILLIIAIVFGDWSYYSNL